MNMIVTKRICAGVSLAALAACAPMTEMDPPELRIDAGDDVHSVRNEVGTGLGRPQTAETFFGELDGILDTCKAPLPEYQDPDFYKSRYGDYYRRAEAEMYAFRDLMSEATTDSEKEIYSKRFRDIEAKLLAYPKPWDFECRQQTAAEAKAAKDAAWAHLAGREPEPAPATTVQDLTAMDLGNSGSPSAAGLGAPVAGDGDEGTFSVTDEIDALQDEGNEGEVDLGVTRIPPNSPLLSLGVTYGQQTLPQTGIGFRRDGAYGTAPDFDAGLSDKHIDAYGFGAGLQYGKFFAGGYYSEGSGESDFSVPGVGGIDSGIVYGDESPSGSSGIATPFGLDGRLEVDFSNLQLKFGYDFCAHVGEDSISSVGTYGEYSHIRVRHWAEAGFSDAPYQFRQERTQTVKTDAFEWGLRYNGLFRTNEVLRPYLALGAGIYHYNAELDSLETNSSNFGPATDRMFDIRIADDKSGWGFHGGASLGAQYQLTKDVNVNVGVFGQYYSEVGSVWNPYSGDQVFFDGRQTELTTEDSLTYGGSLSLGVRF